MKNVFFILLFMINSCSRTHDESNDDKLSVTKTNYLGNELKIDGYYYTQYENELPFVFNSVFFYENGFILNKNGRYENLVELENGLPPKQNNDYLRTVKSYWGLFKIEGNSLVYEMWQAKSFGSFYKVFTYECEIINNETFIVKKRYRNFGGEQSEVSFPNLTYKFVAFANKPDSSNNFIP